MENSNEKDTLPNAETILNAINGLRQEMNGGFDKIELRLVRVEEPGTNLENDVRQIKHLQFSFDVQLDRLESMAHGALQISHDVRADVKVLRAEVAAWGKDVRNLKQKVA